MVDKAIILPASAGHKAASGEDDLALQLAVYQLFEQAVARYTGGESKSVPTAVAQRLMESILLVLGDAGELTGEDASPENGDDALADMGAGDMAENAQRRPASTLAGEARLGSVRDAGVGGDDEALTGEAKPDIMRDSGAEGGDEALDSSASVRSLIAAHSRRCARLRQAARACQPLWQQVVRTMPPLENVALRDTLASIEGAWDAYDPRLFAQELPCSIDYPLAQPVDPLLAGPAFLRAYLQNLLVEARFLARFDVAACTDVLRASCPDWRGLLVSLYEPVAARALVCTLSDANVKRLEVGEDDLRALGLWLATATRGQIAVRLDEASSQVARTLNLSEDEARYLRAFAQTLTPRLMAGGLRGVASKPLP